ncbi:MAG: prolyl oligopeptidase family serine peptidase [Symbiobacteriaceae bacterium]|nr:prolyl oligopeptidase family serine peptidase [Symbiobacteriaceae bacterium]
MANLKPRRITRRELVVENYHGTLVADPYRWLEDDTAPEVQEWMQEQHGDFEEYISTFPVRQELKQRFNQLWRFAKCSAPNFVEGYYYTWRNDGLQNQAILYRAPSLEAEGELVFDPNPLSSDGTVAINSRAFSPKGNYFAYGLSTSGSDWQIIHVLDLKTKQNLPDRLQHMKFTGMAWLPDESGFYYTRYPDPQATVLASGARYAKIYLHLLGEDQSQDQLIYEDPEHPDWGFSLSVEDSKKWAFLRISRGTLRLNQLFFKPLAKMDTPWLPISGDFSGGFSVIGVSEDTAYIYTQKDAPFGKLMALKLSASGAGEWQTVIPEGKEMLEQVKIINNQLICTTLHHASHVLTIRELDGSPVRQIPLPTLGSVRDVQGKQDGQEFFVTFSSFLYPDTVLRYDFTTEQLTTWFEPKVDFPFADYETVQEFYTSQDGTRVPIFITRRKGLVQDGSHPAVLYGYGGYNSSRVPGFSVPVLAWLEKGGVHAEPGLRGGAEYGEAWHRAGMLESKQNTFDDFIAAGEYLIAQKYTVKEKLGIMGRSNGGLLTGACVTQRPDLFGAVIVWVPVLDMLRYHIFTSGRNWIGEYGCAEDPEQFPFMYKYSPLHNVKMNTVYPPTLVMTADTDDRVVPCQARKFTATIQAADGGENPILIRIEKAAGHGQGKPIGKLIEEQTDLYTFFLANLCQVK